MCRKNPQAVRGFTLVELLIVVIILAVLAAIVVPQFASSTEDAKSAAADSSLANLRSTIDLYYQQHGKYPAAVTAVPTKACSGTAGTGALTTEAAFLAQLTLYSDADGGTCSVLDATNHKFGPYLKKATMPADPFMNVSTVQVVSTGDLNMLASGTTGGWKYDTLTGKVIINHTDHDDR
ncbi:type IV pilin protein [Pseudomonas benzenivorans]|uniref:Prepilin-type N-terminal cleavage/methylation domain-containing protein n=1 Tax=Pseudomonas benzenivorans TaxID=556533 RepID=A0ABY5H6R0_9PSED|nr:prepilin-type N-terminal cleavage/methylation domain-containing protein [Pseudomonas benzenivorans]UTW07129.1 prepilin-type N-terminal cleavage/methylation domain-containing protein [Pseudomonas benzenivorans]